MTARSAGQRAADDVVTLLRARNALIWVVTREEARVEQAIADAAESIGCAVRLWDCATGASKADGEAVDASLTDPAEAIKAVAASRKREVWVLRDLPAFLRDPYTARALRSLVKILPASPQPEARAIIVLTPSADVPPELAGHAVVIDWPLPDRAEVAGILDGILEGQPESIERPTNGARDAAIDAAVGLSAEEVQSCLSRALVTARKIDPKAVAAEKKRVVNASRVVEWFDPDPRGLDAVGGLDVLKAWLVARRAALSQKARAFGLPAPRGVLLVGVPGCGKSLTAKAVATAYGVPLLRLDLGGLKNKYVGESEGNLRRALKMAETVAPCVLWLDELEKALGGATQGAADGGVSSDALGTILSWLQEKAGSVFVVATCNDVSALPPELLRKGRFDELFFVDLPTASERALVLAAALKAHGRDPGTVDLPTVAGACADFTGAEIAALVPDALFVAFAEGERAITTADLTTAARAVVPLARTAADKVEKLRAWSKGRARLASTPEVATSATAGRKLDLS